MNINFLKSFIYPQNIDYAIQQGVGSVGSHFPLKPCFMESGSCHSFFCTTAT